MGELFSNPLELSHRPHTGEILGETGVLRERGFSYPRDGEKEDGGTGKSPLLALLRVSQRNLGKSIGDFNDDRFEIRFLAQAVAEPTEAH